MVKNAPPLFHPPCKVLVSWTHSRSAFAVSTLQMALFVLLLVHQRTPERPYLTSWNGNRLASHLLVPSVDFWGFGGGAWCLFFLWPDYLMFHIPIQGFMVSLCYKLRYWFRCYSSVWNGGCIKQQLYRSEACSTLCDVTWPPAAMARLFDMLSTCVCRGTLCGPYSAVCGRSWYSLMTSSDCKHSLRRRKTDVKSLVSPSRSHSH